MAEFLPETIHTLARVVRSTADKTTLTETELAKAGENSAACVSSATSTPRTAHPKED